MTNTELIPGQEFGGGQTES